MTYQRMDPSSQFLISSHDILRESGISITVGTNFDEYQTIVEAERPKQAVSAAFDVTKIGLSKETGFWLIGRNLEGELVHTQAARLLPMGQRTLAAYMTRQFRSFPPAIPDLDLDRSRYVVGPGASRIAGRVVYHGEVWMGEQAGQYRGVGLSSVLARYGLLVALQTFQPDFVFGFMARTVAFKGFAERMGYMHNEPGSLRWYRKGSDTAVEGFLTYISGEEIKFLLNMSLQEIVQAA